MERRAIVIIVKNPCSPISHEKTFTKHMLAPRIQYLEPDLSLNPSYVCVFEKTQRKSHFSFSSISVLNHIMGSQIFSFIVKHINKILNPTSIVFTLCQSYYFT